MPNNFLLILGFLLSLLIKCYATSDDDNDDGASLESVTILLFMFFGLGVGVIVSQILSFVGEAVPYTVLVFLLGLLFSTLADTEGTFADSINQWLQIDAELLLFVFLPPLIFGEAMSLNWYHLKGGFMQSVILAGPGVLIGAALMGSMTKGILPYNWNWNLAMTFGSILSATDPVAVVSLLKNVGASPKLTILIVGESLLNDGSAMVLFTIFFNALTGTFYTATDILAFSFAAAFGSIIFGILCGLFTVRWLRTANRPLKESDVTMQIGMTICCAYLTFFVAQYTFGVSGVLACCGAGAMLAWLGPPIILNHESMHNVWGMAEWALNTMIFLLSGLIIGHRVLQKVNGMDWFYMIFFYFLLMLIRCITILILFPFISDIGHKCTRNEAIFMSWTGLRGALGMTLALIVEKNGPNDLDDETSRLFFYVGGIAALSLVINATTAKALLFKLGLLTTNSAEKLLVTNQIKKKLRRKMDKVVTQMTKEFSFTEKDLEEVRLSCSLLQDINMDALYRDTERMSTLLAETIRHNYSNQTKAFSGNDGSNILPPTKEVDDMAEPTTTAGQFTRALSIGMASNSMVIHSNNMRLQRMSRLLTTNQRGNESEISNELLAYVRSIFLEIVRVKYWHFIEIGKLPRLSFSAKFLLYTIEVGLDEVSNDTKRVQSACSKDWVCLEDEIALRTPAISFLSFLEKTLPKACTNNLIARPLSFLETRKEKREVYMLTSFIEAHEHAQSKIHKFLNVEMDDDDDDLISENLQPVHAQPPVYQSPEELLVIEESKRAVDRARAILNSMDSEDVAAIRSKQAARMVLAKEAEMVKSLVDEGLLTPKNAEEFLENISRDTRKIEKGRNKMYREQAKKRTDLRKVVKSDLEHSDAMATSNRIKDLEKPLL